MEDGTPAYTGGRRSSELGASLSALAFDRVLSADPARYAARRLDEALQARGVEVRGSPAAGEAPSDARRLAAVESPKVADLVRSTLTHSGNFFAEMLAKAVGRSDAAGTTARGTRRATRLARRFGAAPRLADGSGLSPGTRASARSVGRLLAGMRDRPEFEAFLEALPIAGREGTLRRRMRGGPARGRCRAKTGTRPRVSALSGYCRTAAGNTAIFSFLMNRIDPARAKRLEDRMVEAIARYG